jgi:hypothetical protein
MQDQNNDKGYISDLPKRTPYFDHIADPNTDPFVQTTDFTEEFYFQIFEDSNLVHAPYRNHLHECKPSCGEGEKTVLDSYYCVVVCPFNSHISIGNNLCDTHCDDSEIGELIAIDKSDTLRNYEDV